jgi:hypothetical protein
MDDVRKGSPSHANMEKSRHTAISGKLTRSYGIQDSEDLVVEMSDDGNIKIRKEPTDRKLRRGEVLPEVVINVQDAWDNRKEETPTNELESRIDKVLAKLPIADLSGSPGQVGYIAKIWLMRELKNEFENKK